MQRVHRIFHHSFGALGLVVLVVCLLGLFVLSSTKQMAAMSETAVTPPTTWESPGVVWELAQDDTAVPHPTADFACRTCHSSTDAEIEFPSGETLPVQVDMEILAQSVHGDEAENPLACFDCHQTINDYQYPHTPVEAVDFRDYQIQRSDTCERCHQEPHLTNHPGKEAALPVTCTDCHGSHEVQTAETWESGEGIDRCVNCHVQAGIDHLSDADSLRPLIRNGLFADEVDNDYCLACHSQPGLTMTFPNGETKSVTIDGAAFHQSVHGIDNPEFPFECTTCHQNYIYPHQPVNASSVREYTISQNEQLCQDCHVQQFDKALDSVHVSALMDGNLDAAVCTDCHGAHDTPNPHEPREAISQTCAQCHSTIYEEYEDSVHGESLLVDSNPDVPTCVECHGVHDIHDPTTAMARNRSPQLCAECHADEALMAQYEISTDVFDTYVADFHGTTVMLFEHEDPTIETNKAVCYDCHGVHNIKSPDDPHAGINANLLETCQQCHPDATTNFAASWTSHYKPSLENNTLIYLVELFYKIVIPLTLGFFTLMIGTDIYRRIRIHMKRS